MTKLRNLAQLIRSKNAGPFVLTFDVVFDDESTYRHVRDSQVIKKEDVSKIFGCSIEDVHVIAYDAGRAIKVSIPRPTIQGDLRDTDIYGGQQYSWLVDLEVPDEPKVPQSRKGKG